MSRSFYKVLVVALLALGTLSLSGCGYNRMQAQSQQIKARWSDVLNQYQRRADLIPNLVNTVKGFAAQEKSVLLGVTQARSRVGSIRATPELVNDPKAFHKFVQAQGQLTGALSRLMVVSERYPKLTSNQNFRDLQAQIEGTENRIAVARHRYIEAVRTYNTTVLSFPSNLTAKVFGFSTKPNFTVQNEQQLAKPPTVNFSGSTGKAPSGSATTPNSPPPPAGSPSTHPTQLPQQQPQPEALPSG
ncbi:MAG: LemA family protein [Sinobacteraceae bacterium]|nr:LemA family protein [Nevskiaceae bacterium]